MNPPDVRPSGPWPGRPGRRDWLRVARRTGNPLLRRPTPRERRIRRLAWWTLVGIAVAVAAGCLLVYRTGVSAERAEADRRPVTVTVVGQEEPSATGNVYLSDALLVVTYPVDGVTRRSTMPTLFGAVTGSRLDAWTDRTGALVPRPQTHTATVVQTCLAAVGGLVLVVSLGLGCRAALTAWSTRLRSAEWDAEWLLLDTGRAG